MKFPKADKNNPELAGKLASDKVLFGECSRYALYAVHTRGNSVQWFVTDAEVTDLIGFPRIIRQASSPDEAIAGMTEWQNTSSINYKRRRPT